jgi:7-cyano-7-deazaguanine synthase
MQQKDACAILFNGESVPEPQTKTALILLSGGVDSTVLLYLAKASGLKTIALEFNYFGRPIIENLRNQQICKKADVELLQITYPRIKKIDSKTTDNKPIRLLESNGIYYTLAGNLAQRLGAQYVMGGQILSDWNTTTAGQATPEYYSIMNRLLQLEHGDLSPSIVMPFIYKTKEEVVKLGINIDVPFHITWSCTENIEIECGQCDQCVERKEAFQKAGLTP